MFLLRPAYNDYSFVRKCAQSGPPDAVLLRGRHVAPWPSTKPRSQRSNGRELIDACVETHTPYIVDPDTTVLTEVGKPGRASEMPHAQVAAQLSGLPMSPVTLANTSNRAAFVTQAVAFQAGAAELVAPYFRWDSRHSGWYPLDLQIITDVAALGDPRPLSAFVHATTAAMVRHEVAAAAADYAKAGAKRAYLRISGFDARQADPATIRAYREAIDAYTGAGLEVVPDAVGRFGVVLSVAGATGFSSGAREFQHVPVDEVSFADEQSGAPSLFEVPRRWFSMAWDQARHDTAAGVIPRCAHTGCDALSSPRAAANLKAHNVHLFTAEARAAATMSVPAVRQQLAVSQAGWRAAL